MIAKRFCVTCGMLMKKQVLPLNAYCTFTGKREMKIILTCPNAVWYKLNHRSITLTSEYEIASNE